VFISVSKAALPSWPPLMNNTGGLNSTNASIPESPAVFTTQLCDDGSFQALRCPPNSVITILSARFGREGATTCPGADDICAGADVTATFTQRLQSTCPSMINCTFTVGQLGLTNVCPNSDIVKYAEVSYFCSTGECSTACCSWLTSVCLSNTIHPIQCDTARWASQPSSIGRPALPALEACHTACTVVALSYWKNRLCVCVKP
jgi:hypothetical protein